MTSPPSTSSASLNVGILGHVDSGKTTLTRRITTMGSTSAFDAHTAVSEDVRRNTLDLGFSTMTCSGRRLALVDCPGHSGLIRAVLAASTVFDMAIVIIEALAGIQPQTAEHLLLASLFCPEKVVIVVNKIDLADEKQVENTKKKVRKGLKAMGIPENSPIIEMSLAEGHFKETMMEDLKLAIDSTIKGFQPERETEAEAPLLMAIDHCFAIKGKGTVLTGTVIRGTVRLHQEIEFPALQETRKIKTLESWKQKTDQVASGERAAFLVASFDEHRFSRCLVGAPGALRAARSVLATVQPVSFFRNTLNTKTKMHISVAFETVMAECQFLREQDDGEFEQLSTLDPDRPCHVFLSFEKPIFVPQNFKIPFMASRLEQQKGCRFAFSGHFQDIYSENGGENQRKIAKFTRKTRKGHVERVEKDGYSAICTGMFKAETNFDIFRGFQIVTSSGPIGRIEGGFGKSGKFRVIFDRKIDELVKEKEEITLFLKKYSGDSDKLVSYVPK